MMHWSVFPGITCLTILILTLMQISAGEDTFSVVAQKRSPRQAQLVDQNVRNQVEQFVRTKDWAALRRGLEATLVRNGAAYRQLQLIGYNSRYPLFAVCEGGHAELATLLLSAGLPVDTRDVEGDSMLHGAAQGAQLRVVELLLDRGANIDARDNLGLTPLMYAVQSGSLEVVRWLVQAGADTAIKDKEGYSALDLSRGSRVPAIVNFLSQHPH